MPKTSDYTLLSPAFRALHDLAPVRRKEALSAIRLLMASPEPDGVTRRSLPFPYKPGTRGADINGFHLIYSIQEQTLLVHTIVPGGSIWVGDDDDA